VIFNVNTLTLSHELQAPEHRRPIFYGKRSHLLIWATSWAAHENKIKVILIFINNLPISIDDIKLPQLREFLDK
jgi:hypothetical protein